MAREREVIVVGGGVIGAACAWHLAARGARVTVVEGGGARATDASFGWLNASFHLDAAHFALRQAGLAAHRELAGALGLPVRWSGALCWEVGPEALATQREALLALGYPVEEVTRARFAELEPGVADPPEYALAFPSEGAAESGPLADALLAAAQARGARILRGLPVTHLEETGGRITGVGTGVGPLRADEVVVAAGCGTDRLLGTVGHRVPLLDRPALVLRSQPVPPLLSHVLVAPIGEVRQLPTGQVLMPTTVGHQGDDSAALTEVPTLTAAAAEARLRALLPGPDLRWAEVTLAWRPYPEDGRPAFGRLAEGLSVAVLHSGMTLAAIVGDLLAESLLGRPSNARRDLMAPYGPERFAPV